MKFRYDRSKNTIYSDDPEIFVFIRGQAREFGYQWVLYWGNREIGFQSTDKEWSLHTGYVEPDGTRVWQIGDIGCKVREQSDRELIADDYTFESEIELRKAMEIFAEAMAVCDEADRLKLTGKPPKNRVEFVYSLKARIDRGELVSACLPPGF